MPVFDDEEWSWRLRILGVIWCGDCLCYCWWLIHICLENRVLLEWPQLKNVFVDGRHMPQYGTQQLTSQVRGSKKLSNSATMVQRNSGHNARKAHSWKMEHTKTANNLSGHTYV